jgi:hypothetical protein
VDVIVGPSSIFVSGGIFSPLAGNTIRPFLAEMNFDGSVVHWVTELIVGGSELDAASMAQGADGRIYVVSIQRNSDPATSQLLITAPIEDDPDGRYDLQDSQPMVGVAFRSITAMSNGQFALAGEFFQMIDSQTHLYLLEVDAEGMSVDSRIYIESGFDVFPAHISELANGNVLVVGSDVARTMPLPDDVQGAYLAVFDLTVPERVSSMRFGDGSANSFREARQAQNGEVVAVGMTNASGTERALVIRTNVNAP